MDQIWYENPSKSEVIGLCGGDEKNERPCRTDKSRTLEKLEQPPPRNCGLLHQVQPSSLQD